VKLWPRSLLSLSALAVLAATLAGCAPVTPSVSWQRSTFEGFEVISYVPHNVRGIAYFFHGSGGGAGFVDRVETTDVVNRLVAKGYGFVSTASTERTGERRWDASDPSLTDNPDLARLIRLQAHLVASTPLEATTPLVGVGMSNGARFVTLWGQSLRNGGYPVRAIWASHGRAANPYDGAGRLTVPTVFSTSENDFTSPPARIVANYETARAAGTPTELFVSRERTLTPFPYLRIPGIDPTEAGQIFDALVATGVWNAQGTRVVADIQAAATQAQAAALPGSVLPQSQEITNETALQLAVHQFTAEYADPAIAFFERHLR
jgi:hypothetical protein